MKLRIAAFALTFTLGALSATSFCDFADASVAIGHPAPEFSGKGADDADHTLADYKGKWVVLEWLNHSCPFVKKHYKDGHMQALQKKYTEKGVVWLSVISSAPGKQGFVDAAGAKAEAIEKKSAASQIILDPEGKIGRLYGAKTTPHMFVINPEGELVYAGAIDDKSMPFGSPDGATNYVSNALDEAMSGKPITTSATSAYGCSVKYAD